jgi:hypothetical protein
VARFHQWQDLSLGCRDGAQLQVDVLSKNDLLSTGVVVFWNLLKIAFAFGAITLVSVIQGEKQTSGMVMYNAVLAAAGSLLGEWLFSGKKGNA